MTLAADLPFAPLKPGDVIGLAAPSRGMPEERLPALTKLIEAQGFRVKPAPNITMRDTRFAGPDEARAQALNDMFADDAVKAILCVAGGSGASRTLPFLDLDVIRQNPKPFIGFSDITALLHHLKRHADTPAIHGPVGMTLTGKQAGEADRLFGLLRGETPGAITGLTPLRAGEAQGPLTGGNLSLLASICGTGSLYIPDGAILFIEDVDEPAYRADRYLDQLRRAGVLQRISALLLGAFTGMAALDEPVDAPWADMAMQLVAAYDFPVYSHFPAGHGTGNRHFIVGAPATIGHAQLTFG